MCCSKCLISAAPDCPYSDCCSTEGIKLPLCECLIVWGRTGAVFHMLPITLVIKRVSSSACMQVSFLFLNAANFMSWFTSFGIPYPIMNFPYLFLFSSDALICFKFPYTAYGISMCSIVFSLRCMISISLSPIIGALLTLSFSSLRSRYSYLYSDDVYVSEVIVDKLVELLCWFLMSDVTL